MTPLIPTWEDRYRWLVGHHEVLLQKRNDGVFDEREWNALIKQMKGIGLHSMANEVKGEMTKYIGKATGKEHIKTCFHCDGTGTLAPFAMRLDAFIEAGCDADDYERLVKLETEIYCPACNGKGYFHWKGGWE